MPATQIGDFRTAVLTERGEAEKDSGLHVTVLQESREYGDHLLARAATKRMRPDGSRKVDPNRHRYLRVVVAPEDTMVQERVPHVVEKVVSEGWSKIAKEED